MSVKFYDKQNYKYYGYDSTQLLNATNIAIKIMGMEKDIFNHSNLLRHNNRSVRYLKLGAASNQLQEFYWTTCRTIFIPANQGQVSGGCPPDVPCPQYTEQQQCTYHYAYVDEDGNLDPNFIPPPPFPGEGTPNDGSGYANTSWEYVVSEVFEEELLDIIWVNNNIKDSTNNSCTASVLNTFKVVNDKIPKLIRGFFNEQPNFSITIKQYYNNAWPALNVPPGSGYVYTPTPIPTRDTFSIWINNFYPNATDLARAIIIMHEALHCQLLKWYELAILNNDTTTQNNLAQEYGYIFPKTFESNPTLFNIVVGLNPTQHEEMMNTYHSFLTQALYEFAIERGLNRSNLLQYCSDLAWSGCLQTASFTSKSSTEKNRIIDRINVELDPNSIIEDPNGGGNNPPLGKNNSPKGKKCN
ncbi:hypothetical protein ACFOWM_13405 [Ferruginibacter yonginensis]|uniref:Uncharacterized protein n=1 Tax=Ferruginibacter yonginensis TaxID=1310416 RepID=A0ABV8QUF5_9BACT